MIVRKISSSLIDNYICWGKRRIKEKGCLKGDDTKTPYKNQSSLCLMMTYWPLLSGEFIINSGPFIYNCTRYNLGNKKHIDRKQISANA